MSLGGDALLSLAREALSAAGEPEAEVCLTDARRGFARFAGGELGQHMDLEEPQASVRVAHGQKVAEASTSRLDLASLVEAIHEAGAAAKLVPETEGFPGFEGEGGPCVSPARFARATAEATAEARASLLAPVLRKVENAGLFAAGALETTAYALAVATTRGCARSHEGTLASYKVWALETPGAGGAAGYGGHLHRDVGALALEAETERALRIATLSKGPIALEAGHYDVVMEPEALSELLEWLATITFAASEVEQGTSAVHGRAGARVTGQAVTLEDDPNHDGDLGFAAPFDREGTARRRVPLVEGGIAREVLYDRTYASRAGTASTASALVPGSGGGSPIGPAALHMRGGDARGVDELVAGVRRGLYVCRLHYVNGFIEPRRAVMTGLTRDGCFLIEDGKISRPVGNMRFTDSLLEAFERCDGMTRERRATPSFGGDANTIVAPAVRLRAFRFNGRSQVTPSM